MKFLSKLKSYFPDVAAYLFILLFAYAAISKLIEFNDFQTQLGQSPLLGAFAKPISYGVIISEILISVLLAFHRTRQTGFYLFYLLMVMFTAYIIIILNFTSFTPCSCGGVLEDMGWTEHLIFNIAFILLAGFTIIGTEKQSKRKVLINLSFLLVLGSIWVIILFLLSEKEIKRNNAFQRKYMPHALEELGSYQLKSNAFYIAGIDDSLIYLGNYNAPLYLKLISRDLKTEKEIKIEIENYELPYRRVRIEVQPPYFFVGDGTVPVLFRGKTKDWQAHTFSYEEAYFYDFLVIDSNRLAFITTSSQTGHTTAGIFSKEKDSLNMLLNHELIRVQSDGIFDTDGQLLIDPQPKLLAYVYYYRNQYEIADKDLEFLKTGKTIDTISQAQIDVAYYEKEDAYKRGRATMVHRTASIYGKELYINTDRLGKYEKEGLLNSASILDRYDTEKNEYIHSFYFYHQPKKRLMEFRVLENIIIGLVDDQLWVQRIKPEYFN